MLKMTVPEPSLQVHAINENNSDCIKELGSSRKIKCYEIIWVVIGNGFLFVDLQKFPIKENTIYCLTPGQLRSFDNNNSLQGYYISLSNEFMYLSQDYFEASMFWDKYDSTIDVPIINAAGKFSDELTDTIQKMLLEAKHYFDMRTEVLRGLVSIFLVYLSRKFESRQCIFSNEGLLVNKFTTLIKKEYQKRKTVTEYAKELFVSPNYLNTVVKKATGYPASFHIQQQIILEAKRHALYTNLSMKEVAGRLGFDDCSHFSRFFKSNAGVNFSCYKNEIRCAV